MNVKKFCISLAALASMISVVPSVSAETVQLASSESTKNPKISTSVESACVPTSYRNRDKYMSVGSTIQLAYLGETTTYKIIDGENLVSVTSEGQVTAFGAGYALVEAHFGCSSVTKYHIYISE